MIMFSTVYLGLGSNIHSRHDYLNKARELIVKNIGYVEETSSILETEPWGFDSELNFLNQVLKVKTFLSAIDCLFETQRIERVLGRKEKTNKLEYSDRVIDIDILLWNNERINLPGLEIPHPRIKERDFIIYHLKELRVDGF